MKPTDVSQTNTELLGQLALGGHSEAWEVFVGTYRPLVEAVALQLGLGRDDAAEVAQQTMLEVFRGYMAGQYDRSKGRLRSWVFVILRRRVVDIQRMRSQRMMSVDESRLQGVEGECVLEEIWEVQQRRLVAAAAMERLRASERFEPRTLEAFELLVVRQLDPALVARECGLTVEQVYSAKCRVSKALVPVLEELSKRYEA